MYVANSSGFLYIIFYQTTLAIYGYLLSKFIQPKHHHKTNITMRTYNNLVEATNDLMKRGYTENLSLEGDTVDDKEKKIQMTADDFEIDEFYRFEGASNPSDMSIVYAVHSDKYNLKGI